MLSDLRSALRQLIKAPGYSAVIICILALGIGANTAIFSFFRGILIRPLPFSEPERVVIVKNQAKDFGEIMGEGTGLAAADFRDLQGQLKSIQSFTTYTSDVATLTGRNEPDLVYGALVTHDFFSVLGSSAAVGRTFTSNDAVDSSGRLVVFSTRYWREHLGSDASVVGKVVTLNGASFTVVGVMPADFNFPRSVQFWATPANQVPEDTIGDTSSRARGNRLRTIAGRLRPGFSIEQAEQELAAAVDRLPNPEKVKRSIHLVNLRDQTVGEIRPMLSVLLGCVSLVLFIACLNVANLMLSRATVRQREIAVRLAVGSSRWQIARQLLAESLLLGLVGGALGLLLSWWGLVLLVHAAPEETPRLAAVHVDAGVLCFVFTVSILTGLVSGLAPVMGTASTDIASSLKMGGRSGGGGGLAQRLRSALVVCEVALSLTVLVAAALLIRSFKEMQAFSWGFQDDHVISARVGFTGDPYKTEEACVNFEKALVARLKSAPGFESVAVSFDRIGETWIHLPFAIDAQTFNTEAEMPHASARIVSPGYFSTLGITLLRGRDFSDSDHATAATVAIIDAGTARRFFPNGDAIGHHLKLGVGARPPAEIIGIVNKVKSDGPGGVSYPDVYIPFLQNVQNNLYFYIKTRLDLASVTATLSRCVHEIDGGAPVLDVASMEEVVSRPSAARKFPLGILSAFAALALILAAVGIYAVTSYGVAQRTREFGVRMALGAPPARVLGLVIRQGLRSVGVGLILGVAGGAAAAIAMKKMLFGVSPFDLQTFVITPAILAAIGLLACLMPARRATKTDPMVALRAE